jgi:anti-sigma B factor antagonist
MALTVEEHAGAKFLRILDLNDNDSVVEFKDIIFKMLTGGDHKLVRDMAELPYLNSLAIGVMVNVLKRVNESGGKLILQGPRDNIRQLFRILGLDKIFTIVRDRTEALGALGVNVGQA